MSNVEARAGHTLSPSTGKPRGLGDDIHYRQSGANAVSRQRRFAVTHFASDVVSGIMAGVSTAMIVCMVWSADYTGLIGRMQTQMCLLLLLLLGINGALGRYRSNIKSPMERFRLRATAAMLFIFTGMLMWIRGGPSIELAIVPLVGAIALVLGLWIEQLIGARLAKSNAFQAPAVILGTGRRSRALARLLLSQPARGLRPIGFIEDGTSTGTDDRADESVAEHGAEDSGAALPLLG